MTPVNRFILLALLLAPWLPGPSQAAGSPARTYDVQSLLRQHTLDKDPRKYDVVMVRAGQSMHANSIVSQVRSESTVMDGKPVTAWHLSMTFQMQDGSDPMQVEEVAYRSGDGDRLGITTRTNGVEYVSWVKRNHPLPVAATVGDEGPMVEGAFVERAQGKQSGGTYTIRWQLLADEDVGVLLRLTETERDEQGAASGETITDYAVQGPDRLALVRISITQAELPDARMTVTPSAAP